MIDRDQLSDESAHRSPDDVRGLDVQGIEHADGVVGHVVECVGRPRLACEHAGDVRLPNRLELGRESDVAIVVADDVEAALDQLVDEAVIPGDELGAEAHDQQQRRVLLVAVDLVLDLETVGLQSSHALQS